MGACHNTVNKLCSEYFDRMRRHVYVTPKTFLNFIKGYKNMYSDKVGEIDAMRTRLQHGLTKLEEAEKGMDEDCGNIVTLILPCRNRPHEN